MTSHRVRYVEVYYYQTLQFDINKIVGLCEKFQLTIDARPCFSAFWTLS